eukprot:TRINITY_DN2996_c0_g1_i3.p1 TRINITY_DN2996_c0_g1~~TRINITY_DN2996_c0_g1_i3.p1  ORF type:complete len:1061 (+),score=274.19 TRINITY_DN2996_c0_g1_i3:111-3293(+)
MSEIVSLVEQNTLSLPLQLVENVFPFLAGAFMVGEGDSELIPLSQVLSVLDTYLEQFSSDTDECPRGRFGPLKTFLDPQKSSCHSVDDLKVSDNGLEVESGRRFMSILASTCVAMEGRWMYEYVLYTSGIHQIGWSCLDTHFSATDGVGDYDGSFAYDGKRVSKWNGKRNGYGYRWRAGDVVGVYLDLDDGTVSFSLNGEDMGVAFDHINTKEAYFPGIAIEGGQHGSFNFGSTPFLYPREGYMPFDAPPFHTVIIAESLLTSMTQLALVAENSTSDSENEEIQFLMHSVLRRIASVLDDPYVTCSLLLQYFMDLFLSDDLETRVEWVMRSLEFSWTQTEISKFIGHILQRINLHTFIGSVGNPSDPMDAKKYLKFLIKILSQRVFLRVCMRQNSFPKTLEYFFSGKMPNGSRTSLFDVPTITDGMKLEEWEECLPLPDIVYHQEVEDIDALKLQLINLFVDDTVALSFELESPQKAFFAWMHSVLTANKASQRVLGSPPESSLSSPTAMWNLFQLIMQKMDGFGYFQSQVTPKLFPYVFMSRSFDDLNLVRVHGDVHAIRSEYPAIETKTQSFLNDTLFHSAVLLWFFGAPRFFKTIVRKIRKCRRKLEKVDSVINIPRRTRLIRWFMASFATPRKVDVLLSAAGFIAKVLLAASEKDGMFVYVPYCYFMFLPFTLKFLRHALVGRVREDAVERNADSINSILNFIAWNSLDRRCIILDFKMTLLGGLKASTKITRIREMWGEDRERMIRLFETLCENPNPHNQEDEGRMEVRTWMTFKLILKGYGFGIHPNVKKEYDIAETFSDFSERHREKLVNATSRLLKVIGDVLMVFMKLVQSSHDESFIASVNEGKHATAYFNAVADWLRICECLCTLSSKTPLLDHRVLCQVIDLLAYLCQVFSNASTTGVVRAFEMRHTIADRQLTFTRSRIFSPILGIFSRIVRDVENGEIIEGLTEGMDRSLAANFSMRADGCRSHLPFMKSIDWYPDVPDASSEIQSETNRIVDAIMHILDNKMDVSDANGEEEGEDVCSICCIYPANVVFEPCGVCLVDGAFLSLSL